jgi:hypothetical protein
MAMREERKRQYESDVFAWEKAVATIWLLLIAILLIGSSYNMLGRPSLEAASSAEAAASSTTNRFQDRGWSGGGFLPLFHDEHW